MNEQKGRSLWQLAELLAQHAQLAYGRETRAVGVKVDLDGRRAEISLSVVLAPQSLMESHEPEPIGDQSESI